MTAEASQCAQTAMQTLLTFAGNHTHYVQLTTPTLIRAYVVVLFSHVHDVLCMSVMLVVRVSCLSAELTEEFAAQI